MKRRRRLHSAALITPSTVNLEGKRMDLETASEKLGKGRARQEISPRNRCIS